MAHNQMAPILVVGYNRASHLRATVAALINNPESENSPLYVTIDAPVDKNDHEAVNQMVADLGRIEHRFNSVSITIRDRHLGLGTNITRSISEVLADHEKVIVLEDDLVTTPSFLAYMNAALNHYAQEKQIWHIAGYSLIDDESRANEVYLMRQMICWGWATWRDRWSHYNKDSAALISWFSDAARYEFTLGGVTDSWEQVLDNKAGRLDTWAVFWNATIFMNSGLCVNPYLSYVRNIGLDGSGTHTLGPTKALKEIRPLNTCGRFTPVETFQVDPHVLALVKTHYRRNLPRRPYRRRIKLLLLRFLSVRQLRKIRSILRV